MSTTPEHDVLFNRVDHFKGVFTKYRTLPLQVIVRYNTTIAYCSPRLIKTQKARNLYYLLDESHLQ